MNDQIRIRDNHPCYKCQAKVAPFGHYIFSVETERKELVFECAKCRDGEIYPKKVI